MQDQKKKLIILIIVITSLLTNLPLPGENKELFRSSRQAATLSITHGGASHSAFLLLNVKLGSWEYYFYSFRFDPIQRRPQKFFQGGGGGASDVSIIYWTNQNLTAATRILLRSLNQKLK